MDDVNYKKIKAWPFIEALKIENRLSKIPSKKIINFETGYGPSGKPHIGTFAEVLRTNMVRNCFKEISNIPTNLIAFSDDLDALRKVPEDYPFPKKLSEFIDSPLSSIPDFTGQYKSYADRNNNLLKAFLNRFDFDYEFISSTETYKSGRFDSQLLKILENYDQILSIVLPTLRKERRENYSPFLPICKNTGKVLQVPVKVIDKNNGIIAYKGNNNTYIETLVTKGMCKLQWKVDWAMRWSALDIDYEMNGKDLIPSFELSKQIAKFIENKIPSNMSYELFLDEKGEKISKSKGNGLSIEEWLKYGNTNSLSLFMYHNPKRAKRLYFDCIPKSMDEYKKTFEILASQDQSKKIESPIWHIHQKKIPTYSYPLDFTTLLNLVTALNTTDAVTIKEFVQIYIKESLTKETSSELDEIISFALNYYKEFIFPNINKRLPNNLEKRAIIKLINHIELFNEKTSPEDYQKIIYEVGKEIYPNNLRDWFMSLYQVLFGSDSGPRLGSFFKVYGKEKVLTLLKSTIN